MIHGIKGDPLEGFRTSNSIANTPTKAYEAGLRRVNSPGDLVESLEYDLVGTLCFDYSLCNYSRHHQSHINWTRAIT